MAPLDSYERVVVDLSHFTRLKISEIPQATKEGVNVLIIRDAQLQFGQFCLIAERFLNEYQLRNLLKLDLSGNRIGKEGAEVLASCLRRSCSLVQLSLANNRLGDAAVSAVLDAIISAPENGAKALKKLDLRGNLITLCFNVLMIVAKLTELRVLDLSWNSILLGCDMESPDKKVPSTIKESRDQISKCILALTKLRVKPATNSLPAQCGAFKP